MIKAYVLITIQLGFTKAVLSEIKKMKNVESISVVTGEWDVVIKVHVENLDELYETTYLTLSNIKGIKDIITFIVEKEIIPEEA